MRAKTTISISEARKKIFDIANEVQKPGVYYTFTEKGWPKAVMMSAEEFESWQETIEVAAEFPDLQKDLEETKQAFKSGEYKKWITLDELLSRQGLVVADSPKNKYVPAKRKTRGAKKP